MSNLPMKFAFMAAFTILVGCAAPGEPRLARVDSTSQTKTLANCKNIAADQRVERFIVTSYLTTWDSAVLEGAQEGIRVGLEAPGAKGTQGADVIAQLMDAVPGRREAANRFNRSAVKSWGIKTNTLSKIPEPFCRQFYYGYDEVSSAVRVALSELKEYRLLTVDPQFGLFETDFVERRLNKKVRWRDRFVVFVDKEPGSAAVRIFRDVFIDRTGTMFNQGVSVGGNEAYLFTRIDDMLRNPR